MCDRVIKIGKRGGSRTAMALACGVSTAQLRRWARRHPEFALASELANTYAEAWWLELGKANLYNPRFKEGVWLRIMHQRFEDPDRHLRFRRQHKPTSVSNVAAMLITRVVTSSPTGSGSNDDAP